MVGYLGKIDAHVLARGEQQLRPSSATDVAGGQVDPIRRTFKIELEVHHLRKTEKKWNSSLFNHVEACGCRRICGKPNADTLIAGGLLAVRKAEDSIGGEKFAL